MLTSAPAHREGILEYYWGEHIHLGYYSEEERKKGYKKKDFKQAKFDFIDEMLSWSGARAPKRILDVGCGIGGTTRTLARKFPDAQIEGKNFAATREHTFDMLQCLYCLLTETSCVCFGFACVDM